MAATVMARKIRSSSFVTSAFTAPESGNGQNAASAQRTGSQRTWTARRKSMGKKSATDCPPNRLMDASSTNLNDVEVKRRTKNEPRLAVP